MGSEVFDLIFIVVEVIHFHFYFLHFLGSHVIGHLSN